MDLKLARRALLLMLLMATLQAGCGYRVAGHSNSLPKSIHVIAVTALENKTTSYRIEQKLTSATVHEFLARTPYKIVSNAADGDAVLRGKVVSVEAVPLLLDTQTQAQPTQTGRATTMLITVKCEVSLTESATDKVLFHSENFVFRNEYEISTDVPSFFEEQDPALDRLAQDFARKLVAAVIENY
jgi:outer membrane lipopolysaccharide assembly protein LptE/RlpB